MGCSYMSWFLAIAGYLQVRVALAKTKCKDASACSEQRAANLTSFSAVCMQEHLGHVPSRVLHTPTPHPSCQQLLLLLMAQQTH